MKLNQDKFKKALSLFKDYLNEDERSKNDRVLRNERIKYYQEAVKKGFNEYTFDEMIKKLWASL